MVLLPRTAVTKVAGQITNWKVEMHFALKSNSQHGRTILTQRPWYGHMWKKGELREISVADDVFYMKA